MHNLPKLVFDLVTGTFPDALFQHNWWVILMAVATLQKRTTIGRMSKNARLTFAKTVIVSMRTIGLGLAPEAIRDVVLKIGQNGTVEAPWAFLGFFVRAFSQKKTVVSRKTWRCLGCKRSSCKSISYFWENNDWNKSKSTNVLRSRQVNKKYCTH